MQVGLLNVDGFYNSLLSFIDMAVDEGFISQNARSIIISAPSVKELISMLEVMINRTFCKIFGAGQCPCCTRWFLHASL